MKQSVSAFTIRRTITYPNAVKRQFQQPKGENGFSLALGFLPCYTAQNDSYVKYDVIVALKNAVKAVKQN